MSVKNRIERFFIQKSSWVENSDLFNELVQSFVSLIPVFMIGAFVLVIQNFPIKVFTDWLTNACNGYIYEGLDMIYDATYGMVAIYILIVLSFKYSISLTKGFSSVNVLNTITAVASYIVLIGSDSFTVGEENLRAFLVNNTSAKNIFLAVLVSIISTRLTVSINKIIGNRNMAVHIKTDFTRSLRGMLPMVVTIVCFFVLVIIIRLLTGYDNVGEFLVYILNRPFVMLGQTVFSGVLLILLHNFSWFFGIHGGNTFSEMTAVVFPDGSGDIFTKTFFDTYSTVTGSGVTIGLVIVGLIKLKDKEQRKIVWISLIPSIFNINEMVIFGLPVVMNLPLIIPLMIVPVVTFLVAYGATITGLVPTVVNNVNWTTPPLVSGYLATGSWKGVALQLVIIIISVLIYLPFVNLYLKVQDALYEEKVQKLTDMLKEAEKNNSGISFTSLPDKLVRVVTRLGERLKRDVKKNRVDIHYQPQLDNNERVASSEALLRWKGDMKKYIYPPLSVAIAKEFKVYDQLTRQILKNSLDDVVRIYNEIGEYLPVSVNIDVEQLLDKEFIDWVVKQVDEYNIPDNTLGLEITEQENLVGASNLSEILDMFREHGIIVSIDDFSMGYTSLAYLQMNQFDYIKLDGGIVKNIEKNERSKEIVDSLISLGRNLGFSVVAEYVENEKLQNMLKEMGCNKYQGYLYSPAIDIEDYISYIKKVNCKE
ncbi:MAG: PTS sugar transporter subunit IIC/EAL domain-containing protein [Lachnospiraceae bacterium]|nr:PTS sugar transporter subunit IIC/EAL domain-containing protein [Lachnospiraceae bacterium]